MKDFIKNKKGITIIALVVTIIIMIILAGVTLFLVIRRPWCYYKDHGV